MCEFPTEIITEGSTEIVVPKLRAFVAKPSDYAPSKAPVFYNPVMELNRDLAVLSLQAFQRLVKRDLRVCEPLAGCGIRGIRIAREVNNVKEVVINDINEDAMRLAKINVERNRLANYVFVESKDANILLSVFGAPRKRFDNVDIDPFGSPMPYVDSALRATRRNGLIALTATDLAPLCGVHPKACVRKYGGKPLRTEYSHELAIRLLAGALTRSAAKYDL
ncbi:tRNA (guanine(10)-N(2))-dimethyltransferase, partial [Candidatus Bathyarchaeota archaeon]|nr:tRNA (guanine(10)-N(2))-dimethyltransferase [Candidatus Bathyarchaeota archaeon]